ncbi:MAG: flagellar hook-associated protein FlgK, partial [Limnochordales bacterium]
MRPTFFGLDIARRALQAQMRALDVVGHNIANANTPGYSRQVAIFATTPPYPAPMLNSMIQAGQVGTGVQIEAIRRLRDQFVEMQLRNETESLGRWNARYEALKQVELFLAEPSDYGLRDALDQFWQSLQDLHQQPESDAARAVVRERALLLAASFQHVHKQLTDLRLDLNRLVELEVQKINTLSERLANINAQIHRVHLSGHEPNDLLDQRDQLILELAEIVDISVLERDNRTV